MVRHKVNWLAGLALAHDVAASALAWCLAYLFRFNFDIPEPFYTSMLRTAAWFLPANALLFWAFGLYRGLWRYASLPDLKRIVIAVSISGLAVPLVLVMFRPLDVVPRSVLLLAPILLVGLMSGSRIAYRAWKEHSLYRITHLQGDPVLVLGAGDAAVNLVKELQRSPEWRVVGLLDDDLAKQGRYLHGVKVLGAIKDYPNWAQRLDVRHAIVAMPSASHAIRRSAVEFCVKHGASVLTVPAFADLVAGKVTISQVRKIEVEDLLGRDTVSLDNEGLHALLTGQVVMVTGGGGSIGSELCRQIANFDPSLLVLFEVNEFSMYQLEQEFREYFPGTQIVCAMGDVKNAARTNQVIQQFSPSLIFHAAAYKHVPMMEEYNAWEAVQNNVMGSYVVARAAIAHGVKKFVLVSTDKAVNPTNVMGASKRLAEMVCQALQTLTPGPSPQPSPPTPLPQGERGGSTLLSPVPGERPGERVTGEGSGVGTCFEMVRFGNVLGSAGSVIPKFREQIEKGGPVTVTHPDIIRYFMSIPEAAQLVLQAGCMGQGGEIFVMDMGEPVKIVDLARDMIRLSGFSEDEIKIVFSGLRPGEKLFEELLADDEHTRPTPHPKLRIAKARDVEAGWLDELVRWLKQDRIPDDAEVRRDLRRWVPEYAPAAKPALRAVSGAKASRSG